MPEGKYGAPGPQFVQLYEKIQVHAADAQDLIGNDSVRCHIALLLPQFESWLNVIWPGL